MILFYTIIKKDFDCEKLFVIIFPLRYLLIMDNKLRVIRRLYAIDDLIKYRLDEYDDMVATKMEFGLCDESEQYFFLVVSQWTIEQMYYNYFGDIDDDSNEWKEIYGVMEKYIDSLFGKTIKDFFNDRCGE
jgi:hypothetical protein